jgi:hypothetical protein
VTADREVLARMIDPSSWAVFDGYLAEMLRKYKGQDAGYDPEAFKDKRSLKLADAIIAAGFSRTPTPPTGPNAGLIERLRESEKASALEGNLCIEGEAADALTAADLANAQLHEHGVKMYADREAAQAALQEMTAERDAARERIGHWVARLETAEARVAELEAGLSWFLTDERFQVAVGGNPIVVDRMLVDARALLPKAPSESPHNPGAEPMNATVREALSYAADVRWSELAEGSPFTLIDRQMLRQLRTVALAALGPTPFDGGVEHGVEVIPPGWVLVPREPTEAMIDAAKPFRKGVGETAERLHRAMIAAAPSPGSTKGEAPTKPREALGEGILE